MSPLTLPRLGLGCASLAHPEVAEDVAVGTITSAIAAGIGYIDVAPLYGSGLGERRLGRALSQHAGPRPLLSTKTGYVVDGPEGAYLAPSARRHDLSRDGLRRSLEQSFTRLGVDRIDLLLLHEPEAIPDGAGKALDILAALKGEGHVAAIGIGSNDAQVAQALVERHTLDAVLIAGRYTLLDRSADTLLDAAASRGVAVIVGGVFNSGILAAANLDSARFDYRQASPRYIAGAQRLRDVCAGFDVSLRAAALQFARRDSRVASTLIGAASPSELSACLNDLDTPVPAALWPALESIDAL
jgi:D-threo-aldose 1-dehydrogenase